MKDFAEVNDLMISLIEDIGGDGTFTDKSKSIIHDVAEYSRQTELYKRFKDAGNSFMEEWRAEKDVSAEDVYLHMLNKIANAPTVLHRNMSIILFIPIIDDMLSGKAGDICEI